MKNILLVLTLLVCSGCMSTYMRVNNPEKITKSYRPTVEDYNAITELWEMEQTMMHGSILFAIPFIIDLPFTATLDTLCLPYDLYQKHTKKDL